MIMKRNDLRSDPMEIVNLECEPDLIPTLIRESGI